jgi:pseudaminic acid biosynthesis-associated methylase
MNEQEQFWAGEFGNEYTNRNRVDWRQRIPFWKTMIDETGARSVYEFGCNAGWNLSAIRRAYPDVEVHGNDVNETALAQARMAGLKSVVQGSAIGYWDYNVPPPPPRWTAPKNWYDLVFTAGVLIHISPDNLQEVIGQIVDASAEWVLAVEYSSAQEEEVNYRGHAQRLWRRPYGKLYQDMGLEMVRHGPAGKGFDNCTYWLLRKP